MKKTTDKLNQTISNYFNLSIKEQKEIDLVILSRLCGYNEIGFADSEDLNESLEYYERERNTNFKNYIEPYLTKVLPILISKFSNEEVLENKLVIKIAGDKELYDKYLKDILKVDHNQYTKLFSNFINQNTKFVEDFCESDNLINYNIETEMMIVDQQIKNILNKNQTYTINELEWLANHICKRESFHNDMNNKVRTIGLIEHINCNRMDTSNIIQRTKEYFRVMGSCGNSRVGDSAIKINTSNFRLRSLADGNEVAAFQLLKVCFHELQHAKQNKRQETETYDVMTYDTYMKLKCNVVVTHAKHLYHKRHDDFPPEIDANIAGTEMAYGMLEKYAPNIRNKISNYAVGIMNRNLDRKNMQDYQFIQNELDSIVKKDPSLLEKHKYLNIEYNIDGSRKNINQLSENRMRVSKEILDYTVINLFNSFDIKSMTDSLSRVTSNGLIYIENTLHSEVNRLLKQRGANNEMLHNGQLYTSKWLSNDHLIASRIANVSVVRRTIENFMNKDRRINNMNQLASLADLRIENEQAIEEKINTR